jgi:hypothetical protein
LSLPAYAGPISRKAEWNALDGGPFRSVAALERKFEAAAQDQFAWRATFITLASDIRYVCGGDREAQPKRSISRAAAAVRFCHGRSRRNANDLASMLGIVGRLDQHHSQFVHEYRIKSEYLEERQDLEFAAIIETSSESQKALLLVRDSSSETLLPLLERHFRRIILAHYTYGISVTTSSSDTPRMWSCWK